MTLPSSRDCHLPVLGVPRISALEADGSTLTSAEKMLRSATLGVHSS